MWKISFKGRVGRLPFLGMSIAMWTTYIISKNIWEILDDTWFGALVVLLLIQACISLWYVSISVRRLHDLGHSWWWSILVMPGFASLFAPELNQNIWALWAFWAILVLILLMKSWEKTNNKYDIQAS
jgi:uncharacterized membrane protein YhaH (DUF805 family)